MSCSSFLAPIARRLEGKVALITGGASGIGERTARLFSQHGAKVVIADIQDDLGRAVCHDIGPGSATFSHCNVADEANIRTTVDHAVAMYGKLDIMFNNAALIEPLKPSILQNEKHDMERVLAVNVMGPFLGMKHAARVMIPAGRGTIITTASIAAIMSGCAPHGYTASKHAVVGLTKNVAVELGQFGIRVNCIAPFLVATPLAMRFLGDKEISEIESSFSEMACLKGLVLKAEDIANAALYLASDDSRYVIGHNLVVDGGFTIVNPSILGDRAEHDDLQSGLGTYLYGERMFYQPVHVIKSTHGPKILDRAASVTPWDLDPSVD